MNIRTTIVLADYDSFKAALARSIVGVTVKKFKRLGARFYQSKAYNLALVDTITRELHEKLQSQLPDTPLKNLRVTTSMKLNWDENGRIIDISGIELSVYYQVGLLEVSSANITTASKPVKVDLFYSAVDAASQSVRNELERLAHDLGGSMIKNEYDYLSSAEIKKKADKLKVKLVPSVVINDELVLENPSKTTLVGRIGEALTPSVKLEGTKFEFEPSVPVIAEKLVRMSKSVS